MKIRVEELIGEGEILNYQFRVDLKDFTPELFFRERDKALKKHLEMKRRIMSNVSQKDS